MRTVGVFVQPKADMGNSDHVCGMIDLVEKMQFSPDPRPYENANADVDPGDPAWLDPQEPAPKRPELHLATDR